MTLNPMTEFPPDGLSPLDQIRFVEGEITRKLAAAREGSLQAAADAHKRAAAIKEQAREEGELKGEIRYQEMTWHAEEEEARAILANGHNQAMELHQRGETCMESAVEEIVSVVLGLKRKGESHEP